MYAKGLEYIMYKNGVTFVCHYLDDSLTVANDKNTCYDNLSIMLKTCSELGLQVQPKKLVTPSTCVEMLGIIIDSKNMQLRVSKQRLADITLELQSWVSKRSCTKRQLLSLIGKLEFLCKVVRHGRTFIRRLIELSKKLKYLHHRIRLNSSALKDIEWWQYFMPHFHGVCVMYDECWTNSEQLSLWTDASDRGIGCLYKNYFIQDHFSECIAKRPIVWKELYAILVACATWGHHFVGRRLKFNCDNEAVVYCLNSGVSKNVELMTLIRKLFFICASYNFEISAKYLTSKSNILADALSRDNFTKFYQCCDSPNNMVQCKAYDVLKDLYFYR